MDWAVSTVIGLGGFVLLSATYAGFEHHWPSSYRSLSDTYGLRVTARLWRLVSFRAVPIFMVATLLQALTDRASGSPVIAVTVAVGLHAMFTNVRAFVNGLVPGRAEAVINYGSYHLLALLVSVLAAVSAFLAYPLTSKYIPSTTSLTDSLWTAALVAVLGAFLLRLTEKNDDRELDSKYYYERAVRDTGIDLFDECFRRAAGAGTDPLLARAVATAEVLQRPRWLRSAERALGRLRPGGSYGVMQMSASRPISDSESLIRFCREYEGIVPIKMDESGRYAYADEEKLWLVGGKHNGDRGYIDTITSLYRWFLDSATWVQSDDAFGVIGVIEKRRYSVQVGFRIATTCEAIEFSDFHSTEIVARPSDSNIGGWWWLEKRIPVGGIGLWIREEGAETGTLIRTRKDGFFV